VEYIHGAVQNFNLEIISVTIEKLFEYFFVSLI